MLNFSVGPVQSDDYVLDIGGEQVPYFRTAEFSEITLCAEKTFLEFLSAPQGSRTVFMTGSGTASMEAAVINCLTVKDKALIVNGGSFGKRFTEICAVHSIPFDEIRLPFGASLKESDLAPFENKGYTAFIVNIHETSTGVLYNFSLISSFCRRNGLFLIVDAISAFLADPVNMEEIGADVVITGSQKALACAPGMSLAALSPRAIKRVYETSCGVMYFDYKLYLENGVRGQTPFTPAVGIIRQIAARLKYIKENGGVQAEVARTGALAKYFRKNIKDLPFDLFSQSPSNAVSSLTVRGGVSAYSVFTELKDHYGIWICPNGGELKDKVFRVGHIGALTEKDYDALISAFTSLKNKGFFN